MEKIFYFDYCAIALMLSMLSILLYRKLAYGTTNMTFVLLICGMLLTTIFDMGMEHLGASVPLSPAKLFFANFFAYGYFLLRNASNLFYILFILVTVKPILKIKKYANAGLIFVPYLLIVALIFSNLFTGKVFSYSPEIGYQRGPLLIGLYVLSFFYALVGILYLITSSKYIEKDRLFILILQYPLTFAAVGVQFFRPELLIEMFDMAISMLLVLMLVLKPEETMDAKTGILNYRAFRAEMKKYQATRDSVSILMIRLTNSYQVRAYLGEGKFNNYIKTIARQLHSRFESKKLRQNIYFDQSGCFFITLESDEFDMEHEVPKEIEIFKASTKDLSSYGLRFDHKICTLRFPRDVDNIESIFHFAAVFPELMNPMDIYSPAKDLVQTKDFKIRNNMNKILDRAIKEQNLEMYYQPIYSIKEKAFVSAEALIRLRDKEFGFVPPSLFIPAAEQSSFILPIGDFILQEVFRFISQNDFSELGLQYMEINLSVSQCIQRKFSDKIILLQNAFNIKSEQINFEITESAYNNSAEIMDANIKALNQAGFSISLDDYGTGYSNMQRILDIPLSIIKIDKSLVDNMNTKKGLSVVKNTISMMHDINMHLVVEGVETKETFEQLEELDADYIQGYYFSKPLPEKEFLDFLRKNNTRK